MKNKLLLFLLGLLGFAACNNEDERPCMYGPPPVYFTVKGRVTDPAGNPIQGIRITPVETWIHQVPTDSFIPDEEYLHTPFYDAQPLYTDKTGAYVIQSDCFDSVPFHLVYDVEDTDGAANGGSFAARQIDVEVGRKDGISPEVWVSHYEKTAEDIVLQPIADNPEEE